MRKGAKAGEKNSRHSSAVKNLSLKGGGPPAEPGGSVDAKLWQRRWQTFGGLPCSGKEMATTKTSANNGEKNS